MPEIVLIALIASVPVILVVYLIGMALVGKLMLPSPPFPAMPLSDLALSARVGLGLLGCLLAAAVVWGIIFVGGEAGEEERGPPEEIESLEVEIQSLATEINGLAEEKDRLAAQNEVLEEQIKTLTLGYCDPVEMKSVIDNFDTVRPLESEFMFPRRDAQNGGHVAAVIRSNPERCDFLQITYLIPDAQSSAGWGISLNGFDAAKLGATTLVFWVRGSQGGETFEVGLKDTSGRADAEKKVQISDYINGQVTTEWQKVEIPLSRFSGVDTSTLDNVNFGFNFSHGRGTIFVDILAFD